MIKVYTYMDHYDLDNFINDNDLLNELDASERFTIASILYDYIHDAFYNHEDQNAIIEDISIKDFIRFELSISTKNAFIVDYRHLFDDDDIKKHVSGIKDLHDQIIEVLEYNTTFLGSFTTDNDITYYVYIAF